MELAKIVEKSPFDAGNCSSKLSPEEVRFSDLS